MTNRSHVLCTGGAGYIGSHTVLRLIAAKYKVTILDSLVNADPAIIPRLEALAGEKIEFIECDLSDAAAAENVFKESKFDAVIHFAALKAVGESVAQPLRYYRNNLDACINLLDCMNRYGPKTIVFSSSATVYQAKDTPLVETDPLGPVNPYGQTKLMMEQILKDVYASDQTWKISILRYFNPIGAHESGTVGESPEQPMNLLPFIQQVAVGRRPCLNVFGDDWPTRDGTGVRDYLHVLDLADGHVAALRKLSGEPGCCLVHNLGTGQGVSVYEMVRSFEKASGVKIPTKVVDRRPGDLASVIANPAKAEAELNWKASRTIEEACASAWKWQSQNPHGYCKK